MKFLIDQELNLSKKDLLNTKPYASALTEVISNTSQDQSFVIGLFGQWGSGKSSIIKTVKEELEAKKDAKIKFIIYDAWKYSKDSFRRMFLFRVQEDLRFEKSELFDSFYRNKTSDVKVEKKIDWRYILYTGVIFLVGLIFVLNLKDLDSKAIVGAITGFLALTINILGRAFTDYKISVQEPMVFAPEQFEECFTDMINMAVTKENKLKQLSKWVKGEKYLSGHDKIVIVIDNIDRCPKDLAYELITNTKNFLVANPKIVFLIPVDDEALKRHITLANKENIDGKSDQEAEEFLRKIFNVTVRIKPFKTFDIFDFANTVNRASSLNFNATTVDLVAKEFATNPRRIIQFYNNLKTELKIFELKNNSEFIKEHESVICKFLILREEWSEYYTEITKNAYLIQNPDEKTRETIKKANGLGAFLSKTRSIISNIDIEIVDKILSNSDRASKLPSDLIKVIEDLNFEKLEEFYNADTTQLDNIKQYLFERIKIGIERRTFDTEVIGKFKAVCFLASKELLTKSDNLKVQNEIQHNLVSIIPKLGHFSPLIKYNNNLVKQQIDYIDKFIDSYFDILQNKDEQNYQVAIRLFTDYLQGDDRDAKIEIQKKLFEKVYLENPQKLDDYKLPEQKFKLLFDNDIVSKLIAGIEDLTPGHRSYDELNFITQRKSLHSNEITELFKKLLEKYPAFTAVEKTELLTIISNVDILIANQFGVISTGSQNEANIFVTNLFAARRSGRQLIAELENENEGFIVLSFLINVDRLSQGIIPVSNYLQEILDKYPILKEKLYERLLLIIKDDGYVSHSLSPIVFKNIFESESYIDLVKQYLLFKNNEQTYVCDENQVEAKISEFVNSSVAGTNKLKYSETLDECSTDDRAKRLLIKTISVLDKEKILALSESLQELAFDSIATTSNIFNYADSMELLKAIAAKGSASHNHALTNVIITKLQKDETISQGLSIIESLGNTDPGDKRRIKGELERIAEMENFKEDALSILKSYTN